jgi:hypothetical protein
VCGKRILERKPNGLFKFAFGKTVVEPGEPPAKAPVEIFVHGSVKMRCLRKTCRAEHPDHWNVFHFFPPVERKIAQNNRETEKVKPISSGQAENSGMK